MESDFHHLVLQQKLLLDMGSANCIRLQWAIPDPSNDLKLYFLVNLITVSST